MRTIIEQPKSHPVLADAVIEDIKSALSHLAWLDQIFGRAWPIDRSDIPNRKIYEPCIYTGNGNQYQTLIPSADLGNHCFFTLSDPTKSNEYGSLKTTYSLIVWCDLRQCFGGDPNRRDTENLKYDLLSTLKNAHSYHGTITIDRIYEDPKNVYKGFTLDESTNRFTTHPYYAIRIEGTLTTPDLC